MNTSRPNNTLRIIAGQWRGRKLRFPDGEGLRPTTDRIRETLFNWLSPYIQGARCLDAFSGSGALGLEALSRGAASAVLIDTHPPAILALRQHVVTLNCHNATIIRDSALDYLRHPAQLHFDIVFLDPPFNKDLISPCANLLESHHWLADNALIYIESERNSSFSLPSNWELQRDKHAGQVQYQLWLRRNPGLEETS